jgi:hypothetical protein
LNVIAVRCRGIGNETKGMTFCLPHPSAANLDPHPIADRSKLSRFDFLTEYSDPVFNVYETNLIYYGEKI